MKDTWKDFR